MHRRAYLGAVAGGLGIGAAGCIGRPLSSLTVSPEIQRVVHLAGVDSFPAEHDVRLDIELVDSFITDTDTAHFRLTATNEGQERRLSAGGDLFAEGAGESEDPRGLLLYTPSRMEWIKREPDRWVRDLPPGAQRGFSSGVDPPPLMAADESVSHDYFLWDDYRESGYMPPDTYRFETVIPVETTDSGTQRITWGFSLTINRPNRRPDSLKPERET